MTRTGPPAVERTRRYAADHVVGDLAPNELGQYVAFEGCSRFFAFDVLGVDRSEFHPSGAFSEAFRPLNPLLERAGDRFERSVLTALAPACRSVTDRSRDADRFRPDGAGLLATVAAAVAADPPEGRAAGRPWAFTQASLETTVGVWHLPGDADVVLVWPTAEGAHVRVLEVKSAGERKTYHRVQAACYGLALSDLFDPATVRDGVELLDRAAATDATPGRADRPPGAFADADGADGDADEADGDGDGNDGPADDDVEADAGPRWVEELPGDVLDVLRAARADAGSDGGADTGAVTGAGGSLPEGTLDRSLSAAVTVSTGVVTRETPLDGLGLGPGTATESETGSGSVAADPGPGATDGAGRSVGPGDLPAFEDEYHRVEVRRLCAPGGELETVRERAASSFEALDYQLESKCAGCAYSEACHVDAAQSASPRLLGLSPGEVRTLADHGVTSLSELAELCWPPDADEPGLDGWWPVNFSEPSIRDRETYLALASDPGIGDRLPGVVYEAQAMLGALGDRGPSAHEGDAPWLPRAGYGDLPDDDPVGDVSPETNPPGELIRVYLNVQHDHLRDRVLQVAARVSATAAPDGAGVSPVVELADAAPDDPEDGDAAERAVLEGAIEGVFDRVRRVADAMADGRQATLSGAGTGADAGADADPGDDAGDAAGEALVHFYVFDGGERAALQEALERHADSDAVAAFRELWDGRAGADQPMVSQVRADARRRLALRTPSPGLLHLWDGVHAPEEALAVTDAGYEPAPAAVAAGEAPEYVDFRQVFGPRLFNRRVVRGEFGADGTDADGRPVAHAGPPIRPGEVPDYDAETVGLRVRYGAEVPLSYLWSAVGRIDDEWAAEFAAEYGTGPFDLAAYRYHDPAEREYPVRRADVERLGVCMADALRHVERALRVKSLSVYDRGKQPVPLSAFEARTDPDRPATLAEGARDYLGIEHEAGRAETYAHYRKPVRQRVLAGETVPVRVTDVEELDDGYRARFEGDLAHGALGFEDPERVRRACRLTGERGATGGSWVVVSPNPAGMHRRPPELERATSGAVEAIDTAAGEVAATVRTDPRSGEFSRRHDGWTTDPAEADEDTLLLAPGELVWLDPQTDSVTAERAATALEHAAENHLHDLLEGMREGRVRRPRTDAFDAETLDAVADWLDAAPGALHAPTPGQAATVTAGEDGVVVVQGPPGTGKTGGALAPALLARMAAGDDGFAGVVVGPSNRAIDEALADTVETLETYRDDDADAADLPDLPEAALYRVTGEAPPDVPDSDAVRYVDYHDEADDAALLALARRLGLRDGGDGSTGGDGAGGDGDGAGGVEAGPADAGRDAEPGGRGAGPGEDEGDDEADDGQVSLSSFAGGDRGSKAGSGDRPGRDGAADRDRSDGTGNGAGDGTGEDGPTGPTLVFVTPTRLWSLVENLLPGDVGDPEVARAAVFDLLAVDEGSMLELPDFLLAGAQLRPGGQVLVGGDQRQLPPVQRHDWASERRRSVLETAPHLSALDYLRFLGGEDVLDGDRADAVRFPAGPEGAAVRFEGLETGWRFGPTTTDFLRAHVYAGDGLDYGAGRDPDPLELRPPAAGGGGARADGGEDAHADGGDAERASGSAPDRKPDRGSASDRGSDRAADSDPEPTADPDADSATDSDADSATDSDTDSATDSGPGPVPAPTAAALAGPSPVTVLVYDDGGVHRMVNEVEATLVRLLGRAVHPDTEMGVVTPHNAQRGRVSALFDEHLRPGDGTDPAPTELGPAPTVETVERFQGDQRELMVLSGTVSDPEFVAREADFLLNLNRVNVSLSRHVSGLVVVAARSLFGHVPGDVDAYDDARLWPALASATGLVEDTDPAVGTDLEALLAAAGIDPDGTALSVPPGDVDVEAYHL